MLPKLWRDLDASAEARDVTWLLSYTTDFVFVLDDGCLVVVACHCHSWCRWRAEPPTQLHEEHVKMFMTPRCSTVTFCGGCGSGLKGSALKHFVSVVVVVVVVVSDVYSLHSHLDLLCRRRRRRCRRRRQQFLQFLSK